MAHADDTSFLFAEFFLLILKSNIQDKLKSVLLYSSKNELIVNADKTYTIRFNKNSFGSIFFL